MMPTMPAERSTEQRSRSKGVVGRFESEPIAAGFPGRASSADGGTFLGCTMRFAPPRQLDVDLDIDRGDLVIELAETQPLTIAADMSRRGDFSSDLPVTMQRTGRNFLGTINGGGPELRIEADRSDIRLRAIN